jgi:hypothetical protein
VAADNAVLEPAGFRTVTAARSVVPTSLAVTVYVAAVAPATDEQAPPAESQRRHWNAYVIGCVPDQTPVEAVSGCPSCAVPLMTGVDVAAGGEAAATTTADWAVVADEEPSKLEAVTRARSVVATSDDVSVYVAAVAPVSGTQRAPAESQLSHWYEYAIGVELAQLPVATDSVSPARAVPAIEGGRVLVGAVPKLAAVVCSVTSSMRKLSPERASTP